VGKKVKDFKPGDELFGDVSGNGLGAFGEYVCAKESAVARRPSHIPFEQAAALPVAGVTALQGLRLAGQIRGGQRVLINGASSGVGTFAVQIAKANGAEVTAVCGGGKADAVRAVGADHVIDSTREDFTKSEQRYDVILDIAMFRPVRELARALVDGGSCVVVGGSTPGIFKIILFGWFFGMIYGKRFRVVTARATRQDLELLMQLLESGKVKPYIDKTYPLSETAEAIRYLQERHARGKVVIVV
jgi:NADPH:quinone reductase-like Zn-dependent oxidoreductase